MHAALPLLCLGIGIDDMFVILQCLANTRREGGGRDAGERVSRALQQAGVSITVTRQRTETAVQYECRSDLASQATLLLQCCCLTATSLTDVFAFAVGAVTNMPGLQSFCVCTAIALAAIFLLQVRALQQ